MSDGGSGAPHDPYDSDRFHTSPIDPFDNGGFHASPPEPDDTEGFHTNPYPQPPIIWAPTPPRPINAFATLSVVFAFLFAPVGVVFGHLGLLQIRLRRERGRKLAGIGLTLSYAFTLIAVAVLVIWTVVGTHMSSTVATSPTSATIPTAATSSVPEQPLVTAAQLPKLLLSIDEVKHAVNAPNLAKVEETAALIGSQGITVTPPECLSAVFASTKQAYQHSAVRGMFSRAITGEGQGGVEILNEAISTFENMSAATSFVDQLVGQWRGCAGKSVSLAQKGTTITIDVGEPVIDGTVMTLQNSLQGSLPGFSSDRAIAAKNTVVIDLDAQGFDMGNALKTLANQIQAK